MACCMAGMWQCLPQPLPSSISTPLSSSWHAKFSCCCPFFPLLLPLLVVVCGQEVVPVSIGCWNIIGQVDSAESAEEWISLCLRMPKTICTTSRQFGQTTTATNAGAFRFRGKIKAISSWSVASHNDAREEQQQQEKKEEEALKLGLED